MARWKCPKCGVEHNRSQQYCKEHHAEWMREWRKTHPRASLSAEAKKKANARSYAHVYRDRGKIRRSPCEVCGKGAEMHHDDYDKPTEVHWLCREHHLEQHGKQVA